jgi:glycopeptide antibiotics resistance protein
MTTTACPTKYKGDQNTLSKVTGITLYITVLPFGIMLHYMPNAQAFWSVDAQLYLQYNLQPKENTATLVTIASKTKALFMPNLFGDCSQQSRGC